MTNMGINTYIVSSTTGLTYLTSFNLPATCLVLGVLETHSNSIYGIQDMPPDLSNTFTRFFFFNQQ